MNCRSPSKLPKCPMEKCNDPELGVIYYYKHFLKILCKFVKKWWFYRHFIIARAVERQSAIYTENIGFASPTLGQHISTFRGYRIFVKKWWFYRHFSAFPYSSVCGNIPKIWWPSPDNVIKQPIRNNNPTKRNEIKVFSIIILRNYRLEWIQTVYE
jgi:hypothetical protein